MKKIFAFCAFAVWLLTAGLPAAAEETSLVHFTLFLRDDSVLNLDSKDRRLALDQSAFDIVAFEKSGETYKETGRIQWPRVTREIYSIDLINANRSVYDKAKLLLTRQDGSREVIEYGSLQQTGGTSLEDLYLSEYNRIAGRWTTRSIPIETVKKIVLGSTGLMVNPKTGTLYPPDYRYDPYTGAPLAETAIERD